MAYVCGKCGSSNLYQDYLPGVDEAGLACLMCGNRGEYGFKTEVKKMTQRIKGRCTNCKREDLMINLPRRMCGSCENVIRRVKSVAEQKAALQKVAEHFAGKPKSKRGKKRRAAAVLPQETFKNPGENSLSLTLIFDKNDQELLEKLRQFAKCERRTSEQQVLWIIEKHLEAFVSMQASV